MYKFKDTYGKDFSYQDIIDLVQRDYEYEVFVGSDSQVHKRLKKIVYVTCIVLYKKGHGGRVFVCKELEKFANSLKERLQKEVWRSLEVAFELKQVLPSNVDLIIHVDVNSKKKFKSSEYMQEFVGMITSQGFKCVIKPDAWAAQSCANKATK
jgi:predicted RNase H-related nuclease YkuK (DUF458 family)